MSGAWQFFLLGLALSSGYVLAAQGIVVIHRGSGVVNFAQGGFALIGAYASFELQRSGLSPLLALLGGLLAAAAAGALTYALVMRWVKTASQLVRVVATLSVSVIITQLLALHFADRSAYPAQIIRGEATHIFGASISPYEIAMFGISILVTAVLWAVYRFTRFGLQTSAVSENARSAAALGHSPDLIGLLNWTIGGALGGLAGVLIAPTIGLTVTGIGLLLLPVLAAAVLGRFNSFWLTLVGGLIVAVGTSELTKYNAGTGWSDAFPFLVVILILTFRSSAILGRGEAAARIPEVGTGRVRWLVVLIGTVVLAVIIAVIPSDGQGAMSVSLTAAIIGLSSTVVTGYAGQVSLAQVGLAGAGGFVAAKLSAEAGFGFWPALIAGILVALPVGGIVGLPALRTRGVNLAIVTLGLGLVIQAVFLNDPGLQGNGNGFVLASPSLFGYSLDGSLHPGRYATLCLIALLICGLMTASLRRGRVGRQLIALRANERAAAAAGVNLTVAKLYAFVVGAGMAGLAGVLIVFQSSVALFVPGGGGPAFDPATSIVMLSLVILGGVGYIGGSLFAGQLAASGIGAWLLQEIFTSSSNVSAWLALIGGGVGAVLIVIFNPDGVAAQQARDFRKLLARLSRTKGERSVAQPAASAQQAQPAAQRGDSTLTVDGLGVRFGGVVALTDVALTVRSGEIVGLIGPNGAGKTTLIDAVTGFNRKYAGRVLLDGQPIDRHTATARARMGIGRSFQSLELFDDLTIEDNLRVGSELPTARHYLTDLVASRKQPLSAPAIAAIHAFGLTADLERMPPDLPFGQRRLIGIARAVAAGPRVLLLDEPAAGLDDHESDELAKLLKRLVTERGIGILLVEHNVDLVMGVCDRVVAIDFGRVIVEGPPRRVRHDPAVISAYLGTNAGDPQPTTR